MPERQPISPEAIDAAAQRVREAVRDFFQVAHYRHAGRMLLNCIIEEEARAPTQAAQGGGNHG